jgi:hypothetical protein
VTRNLQKRLEKLEQVYQPPEIMFICARAAERKVKRIIVPVMMLGSFLGFLILVYVLGVYLARQGIAGF